MKFLVHLADKNAQLMTEDLIKSHVEYLRNLKKGGALPFCGFTNKGTALMILSCDSIEAAGKIIEEDPFTKVNYYSKREIVEIEEADETNNFHLDEVLEYLSRQ